MARYIRTINGYNQPVAVKWRVAANNTINVGDIVQLHPTSKYLEAAKPASTTLVGIAEEAIVTGATVTVDDAINITPLTGGVFRVSYVGSTKASLADTDLALVSFDLADKTSIDLDDTTGGMCSVVAYDNKNKMADVIFAAANVTRL